MTEHVLMSDEQLVERAAQILMHEIGPVETGRFLAMPHTRRQESLQRHCEWQQGLNQEAFVDQVFGQR